MADYWRSDFLLWPRAPSWGARLDIEAEADDQTFRLILPAKRPLIDPLRDTLSDDDPTVVPLAVEVEGE